MYQSMDGWMDGGMDHGAFYEGDTDKSWGQWTEEQEQEDEGRGKWQDIIAKIEFATGNNGDGGCGGPVEGKRELQIVCV